ncbi:Zn-ribbon containing protein [Halorubrum ejinorense]|uniref:Zn-ribbon containing protein n=1 Tax=Halorubrum ejinorense TaxID=425309 RepID=A0AAV3SRP4_9EURY
MPHQCTTCGRTFPDGSKEMLSGCPDCGGNKFQFQPASAVDDADPGDGTTAAGETTDRTVSDPSDPSASTPGDEPASTPDEPHDDQPPTGADPTPTGADDARTSSPDPTPDTDAPSPADAAPAESATPAAGDPDGTEQIADRSDEDTAQASARSDVVSPDELDRASREVDAEEPESTDEGPRPGLDALRDELNEQFESIRIVSPGQYELNLMELYDRQEYIISLQEDGRYVIEMPDAWGIEDE